ncbi:MAG: bacteriocin family protein [Roseburia sp.]|nr:bacteriocin family protein [Roseburia sp.]
MDYFAREDAPISAELWNKMDEVIIQNAKQHMVCRRFLNIYGPLGPGASYVTIDSSKKAEEFEDNMARVTGRRVVELPQLYQDFSILWRDIAEAEKNGWPLDLASAAAAAQRSAKQEDEMILFGNKELGMDGLFTADGSVAIQRGDWTTGEDAYKDVARGISYFASHSMLGRYALIVSPDLYLDLQRLQPNVGLLEIDRIKKLVNDRVYQTGPFGLGKAVLVCAEPQYMDLAVGVDLSAGYLETREFNHYFRITETIALRIKNPAAIVVFQ